MRIGRIIDDKALERMNHMKNRVMWQYCKDLNDINRAIDTHDENWEGLTSAEDIVSIGWDTHQGCYVVFWKIEQDKGAVNHMDRRSELIGRLEVLIADAEWSEFVDLSLEDARDILKLLKEHEVEIKRLKTKTAGANEIPLKW